MTISCKSITYIITITIESISIIIAIDPYLHGYRYITTSIVSSRSSIVYCIPINILC